MCSYTDGYKKASCSPCLFLLEEKNSNHRARCSANRAAYPQKASPEIRLIFAGIVRVALIASFNALTDSLMSRD